MSRILISTMVVGVLTTLGSSTGVAQSLNINPYPAEKAGTLSSSGPDLYEPEPVEVFAKEIEEDVLMIERERTLEAQEKAERLRLKKQSEALSLQKKQQRLRAEQEAAAAARRVEGRVLSGGLHIDANPLGMTPMPDVQQASAVEKDEPKAAYKPQKIDLSKTVIKLLSDERSNDENVAQDLRPRSFTTQAGESLEDVLRSWSQTEGVGFLWKTTHNYQVVSSVSSMDSYEASVEALLNQHVDQETRPVAKLFSDPVTGTRTLSVFSE